MTETISIVTAGDRCYVPHVGAMLHSLFTANEGEKFEIHFLHRRALEGKEELQRLQDLCVRFGAKFTPVIVDHSQLDYVPVTGKYIEEAWYRLILPEILPQSDKLLWLDADLIVLGSIKELWKMNLEDAPLAAVPNALGEEMQPFAAQIEMGGARMRNYFNSGVMLMSLQRMREMGSEQALRQAIHKFRDGILHADQDILSTVYWDTYKPLSLQWNVIAGVYFIVRETIRIHGVKEYQGAIRSPRIVHFTRLKPWLYGSFHPYRKHYLHHRVEAGWGIPEYTDVTWRNWLIRKTPMYLRTLLGRLRKGHFYECWVILKAHMYIPTFDQRVD